MVGDVILLVRHTSAHVLKQKDLGKRIYVKMVNTTDGFFGGGMPRLSPHGSRIYKYLGLPLQIDCLPTLSKSLAYSNFWIED